ncbi:MAG: hydantoinase B/oxoprolinase family protein [Cyanobacteria bacterium P01_G01_bin.54]
MKAEKTQQSPAAGWQFWIDRGGTFTDIVAQRPDGSRVVHKLLSENPEQYADAPIQGIREILGLTPDDPLPTDQIMAIKMGTTVATNALLEHKGDRVVFVTTQGFRDVLRIGDQNRPDIFACQIQRPLMLYEQVIEAVERIDAQGQILQTLDQVAIARDLKAAFDVGIRSCAIALMHGYRYSQHEQQIAEIAHEIGFTQISVSHQVSPLMKLVSRGDTTVVDAYLSPILRRYVDRIAGQLSPPVPLDPPGYANPLSQGESNQTSLQTSSQPLAASPPLPRGAGGIENPQLLFMQSHGGLTAAAQFQGKDSILSGPAGGIVGAVKTAAIAGFTKIIGFDMGGTSTDVSHYAGAYERTLATEIAGVRLRTPMMAIHTVAAGGGSIVQFEDGRYRVGPESAGANPGPAAYGRGGPLTITDCNVMLGKVQPGFFPRVFGPRADRPLDHAIVQAKFQTLAQEIGDGRSPEQIAAGLLAIAIEKMANAIKFISLQRGYDVSGYTLCCFGGAGGQHACQIAEALGMRQILVHPYAGVLSAYGMGLADVRVIREQAVELTLTMDIQAQLRSLFGQLDEQAAAELKAQDLAITPQIHREWRGELKYAGSDSTLTVSFDLDNWPSIQAEFEQHHRQRYGFVTPEKPIIVEAIAVEWVCSTSVVAEPIVKRTHPNPPQPLMTVPVYFNDWQKTPIFDRAALQPGDEISGPAILTEATGTNVIEPGWQVEVSDRNHLIVTKTPLTKGGRGDHDRLAKNSPALVGNAHPTKTPLTKGGRGDVDPVLLEIFNNLFRAVAEQMGTTLQNTSYSVNIKERLDFSCALFDGWGHLVANAPHIPVHLGSMSASVASLIQARGEELSAGDVFILNNPYNGGTHLPDVTVITPVFLGQPAPVFFVASRGHHADIGGITPGSMPPHSTDVSQEGVLFDNDWLVRGGVFQEAFVVAKLTQNEYPARNPTQNLADLQAQIAANERGVQEVQRLVEQYGLATVQAYMSHVQANAAAAVRAAIATLHDGEFTCPLDSGGQIQVKITIDRHDQTATIDFTGTSPQQANNFNAPAAIAQAVVLYVFRTLVAADIPLNYGCLEPLRIILPPGSLLNPTPPAAVVAGNVETSQAIADCLYGALEMLAASQGTMNNFTFGNAQYQYYETICGGSGAGPGFAGTDAVQTHMTNSRLTDPEVLEWRFPVLLESFGIRAGSGGAGQYPGGNGVVRRIQFREAMTAAILSGRRLTKPFGLAGGQAGRSGKNWIMRANGELEHLQSTVMVAMEAGDAIVIETPGGGGFGIGFEGG